MSLSVCLITRYAQDSIARAVRSVAGVADQVVVVDTGSKDDTVAHARAAGAQTAVVEWQDDFSAAQNHALDLATGDWIFWLNHDEEFLPESTAELQQAMTRADVLAYMVLRQDIMDPQRPQEFSQSAQLRLFRKLPELRWVGRSHAVLEPPPHELARGRGMGVELSGMAIRRHAYESPVTPAKLRWSARLLELELRDRPQDLTRQIELARTLLLLKDERAHALFAQAVEQLLPHLKDPLPPCPLVGVLLEYVLRVAPQQYQGKLPQAAVPDLVRRWFPTSPPLLWVLAERHFAGRSFAPAAVILEALVAMGRTGQYDLSQPFDASIIGPAAQMNLGICYTHLAQPGKAQACWLACLNDPRQGPRARELLGGPAATPPVNPPGSP